MWKKLLAIAIFSFGIQAQAGLMEVSYQFARTESKFDDDNFSRSLSHTGSLAWYFMEMSALEVSYTQGEGQISSVASSGDTIRFRTDLKMYGADLVFTLAGKDWAFQPYVKGGAAWVDKKIFRKETAVSYEELVTETDKDDAVPSMGAGFRFRMTKSLRLKASYDRWRSGKDANGEEQWDDAVRAGISVFF